MTDEAVKEFLIESAENLDRLDVDLVELEKDPANVERLASIFRTIHTIKGTCGFLAFSRLEAVSHVGESLLAKMRDGSLVLNSEIATALLAMVDAIRRILSHIEATGTEPAGDDSEVIAELSRLKDGTPPSVVDAPLAIAAPPLAVVAPLAVPATPLATTADAAADDRRTGDERRTAAVADTSLRIDVSILDKLMNLVGELVLARNQILQFTAAQNDTSLTGATQRLNLVTSELQEGVMKTRMQPIGNIWSKFPRIVRDLATQVGKQVELQMEGKETDLDKTIIEAIKDPLTHIVRNSVDHGIERPDVRVRAGKPAEGHIRLRAYHEGGQINIEIVDDGAGIDPAKVRATAIRRGVISSEVAARLSDHEVINLVFQPGFSTAETVTNLSGRGVGMDVVKTNIEKIGGQVDVHSRVGEGTTLKIKIPLTLAIISALIVTDASRERYAIPQVSLLELVRLEGEQVAGIEWVKDVSFFRLRGNLLPLVHLDRELKLGMPAADAADAVNIVVLKADNREFGLVVDTINDTEEIVVKPLSKLLKGVSAFAGATIMGDGRVALILDVLGLAQQSGVVADLKSTGIQSVLDTAAQSDSGEQQTLLLFQAGEHERMAIPLQSVARLEEFPSSMIETSGDRLVVQYRDEILPLVTLNAPRPATDDGPRHVIVFRDQGRSVGLMVDRIIDIVSDRIVVQERLSRKGVLGSAVIQGRVTELLDVTSILVTGETGVAKAA